MSHATVLIISKKNDEDTIQKMMEPYWELDLSREDLKEDPRAVFVEKFKARDLQTKFEKWVNKMLLRISKTQLQIKNKDFEELKQRPFIKDMSDEEIVKKLEEQIEEDKKILKSYNTSIEWVDEWHGYYLNKEGIAYGYYINPNDKWDWYQIGGRWAGMIKLKKGAEGEIGEKSFMFKGNPYEDGGVDSAQVKNIDEECLKSLITYAVLDEEGWHEKSRMGWWGCSQYDKYCCVVEEINIHEILHHFKHDYFGINHTWKGYSNEYVELFIKTLHSHYYRDGKVYKLKNNLGQGRTELTDDLKRVEFFRNKHWQDYFYNRFIKNLAPDMYLTIVDYHI